MATRSLVLALLLLAGCRAQMVPQCLCTDVEPCKRSYVDSVIPCADACQQHAAALGANYQSLRQCLMAKEANLRTALSCTENNLQDSCARQPGPMVPKRYAETLKIAALSEINRILTRSGVANEVKELLATGKKFYACAKSCMDKKSGSCAKRLGCGLKLPSDTALVQQGKQCAIQAGFDTAGVQQLCQCAVGAGLRQLANVCSRLVIS